MAKFNRVLKESCCGVVGILQDPHLFFFARFKPAFCFINITLVAVTAIYFVTDLFNSLKTLVVCLRSSFKNTTEHGYRLGQGCHTVRNLGLNFTSGRNFKKCSNVRNFMMGVLGELELQEQSYKSGVFNTLHATCLSWTTLL